MLIGGSTWLDQDAVVVLDVDDTLYLEESYVRSGFETVGLHLADSVGVVGVGDTLWANFREGVRGDAFDRALLAHGLGPDAELIATLVEVYRTHKPSIELLPDADSFLRSLQGLRTAAITDGPVESQRRKIEALSLERFLDMIVVTAELGSGLSKPHHRAFEIVEERFDAPPQRCIYIGDNPAKDFVAPQQRGWRAIRVRRPSSLHFDAPTPPGVIEIQTLQDLTVRYQPTADVLVQSETYQR